MNMELKVKVSDIDFQTAVNRWFSLNTGSHLFNLVIPPDSYEYSFKYHPFPDGRSYHYYTMTEESAAKVEALNGPHWQTIAKAWVIRMEKANA